MADPRLPTDMWVRAHIRRLSTQGKPIAVLRRGEPVGGLVVVRVNTLGEGTLILSQTRDIDGNMAWLAANAGKRVPDSEADAYVERAVKRDPDLWVVEVEDRTGANPFEGRILV